jgi:hypothetical protein
MALVKADKDGMMNDFEAAASYLLPYVPVAKKRKPQQGNKRNITDISDAKADGSPGLAGTSASAKVSMGKTGVEFRFTLGPSMQSCPQLRRRDFESGDSSMVVAKVAVMFWSDAIAKEMHNAGIAFEIMEEDQPLPVGFRKVTGHMVFDVKMDYTCKARWVLDSHKSPPPERSTYAGVVSCDSVPIALTNSVLNDLDVWAADIHNAYLQAPSSQKDYVICGPEFGLENVGKRALIRQALYGGKTAGADFRNHLRECMRHLNFTSSLADPDVWMPPAKKTNGSECYEYVLIYTDDVLVNTFSGLALASILS